MEKNIHTLLFSSLVSLRESRLIGFAGEKPEEASKPLEAKIQNPTENTDALQQEILQFGSKSPEHQKHASEKLQKLLDARKKDEKDLQDAKDLTNPEKNADWKKIIDGIKPPKVDAEALKLAKAAIMNARTKIVEIGVAGDTRPKNAIAQVEALNKVILDIQALDPKNTVQFVEGVGGAEDDKKLAEVKALRATVFKADGVLEKAIKAYTEDAKSAPAKEEARKKLDDVVNSEKEDLWQKMGTDVAGIRGVPFVNAEEIAKAYTDLIKEVVGAKKAAVDKVEGTAPAAPIATIAKTPGAKAPESPATAELPTPEADKALAEKGVDAAKIAALTGAKDDAATGKALEDLNKDVKVEAALKNPADSKVVVDALNKKLEAVGSKKRVEVKENKLVTKDESVVAKEAASKGSAFEAKPEDSKETKDLKSFFKAILDFITELAAKLGMSPRELITGVADPAKLNSKNAPTKALQTAAEAETKNAEQNKKLAEEAAARAKAAPKGSPASIKAEGERKQFQEKADRQLRNAQRLEEEADKAVNKDKECDKTARKIQEEAKRRGVQADVETTPEKRGVVIRPKGGVNPNTLRSFAGEFQQELGANRVTVSGNTFIINYMPNNSGNVQNQINGRDGVQIQGGKTPEAPVQREATPVIKKEVVPPTPAPSVKEEATARPIIVTKKKAGPTGNLQ